jgi:co-chaperonin GroES (HSP10)
MNQYTKKKKTTKMENQRIVPVGKRVLILEQEPPKFYPNSSVIMPDTLRKKTYKGTVIAIGNGVTEIKVGDLIQYVDYATPISMTHNGEEHLLIAEGDVLAVIVNE